MSSSPEWSRMTFLESKCSIHFVPEAEVERGLLTRTDILRQERYCFLTALLSSEGRIYLSWHRTEADKPVLRSMFLDAVEGMICCSLLQRNA